MSSASTLRSIRVSSATRAWAGMYSIDVAVRLLPERGRDPTDLLGPTWQLDAADRKAWRHGETSFIRAARRAGNQSGSAVKPIAVVVSADLPILPSFFCSPPFRASAPLSRLSSPPVEWGSCCAAASRPRLRPWYVGVEDNNIKHRATAPRREEPGEPPAFSWLYPRHSFQWLDIRRDAAGWR